MFRANRGTRAGVSAIVLAFVVHAVPARAQGDSAPVRVDGRVIFRVGATSSADAEARARAVERRIATLVERPELIEPARVVPGADPETRAVTVAGAPLVTVTAADAEDNLTTVDTLAAAWAQAATAALEQARDRRLSWWGRFGAEVRAAVETAFGRLAESSVRIIPRALAALLVVGLFWTLASGVRRLMRAVFARVVSDLTAENLIKQVAYYTVWALGLVVAADALGFDPATVVTGLGLTSLALGFALKDIISNFVSGVLILLLRPFEVGDQIVVEETEGTVERIELRATKIRTYDGRLAIMPNAELFTSRVINNTASRARRGSVTLYVGYGEEIETVSEVACAAAAATPNVAADPPVSSRVRELGSDDVVVEVRFWCDAERRDFVATASAVRIAVVAALKREGVGLPDPAVRAIVPRGLDRWREAIGSSEDGPTQSAAVAAEERGR